MSEEERQAERERQEQLREREIRRAAEGVFETVEKREAALQAQIDELRGRVEALESGGVQD